MPQINKYSSLRDKILIRDNIHVNRITLGVPLTPYFKWVSFLIYGSRNFRFTLDQLRQLSAGEKVPDNGDYFAWIEDAPNQ